MTAGQDHNVIVEGGPTIPDSLNSVMLLQCTLFLTAMTSDNWLKSNGFVTTGGQARVPAWANRDTKGPCDRCLMPLLSLVG